MCLANNEHQRHLFDATLGATDEGMHRSSSWEQDLRGIEMNVGGLRLGMIVGWLQSCTQWRHEEVRMIARMLIGALLPLGNLRIGNKPRMVLR